jgi:multiple sugar transport system substrate-binding protein
MGLRLRVTHSHPHDPRRPDRRRARDSPDPAGGGGSRAGGSAERGAHGEKFLIDYTTNFRQAFVGGEFYDFPCFPKTVPDLNKLIVEDPEAHPPDKYKVLDDVLNWATNVGYPGYATAAIDEIFSTWVLNVMFAKAASGAATPEEALKEADAACKRIFAKWKEKGLV